MYNTPPLPSYYKTVNVSRITEFENIFSFPEFTSLVITYFWHLSLQDDPQNHRTPRSARHSLRPSCIVTSPTHLNNFYGASDDCKLSVPKRMFVKEL